MTVAYSLLLALGVGLALPPAVSAQSAGAGSSKLLTYSNPQYGFSLLYPASLTPLPVDGLWSAAEDFSFESVSGTPIVSFTVSTPYFTAEARIGFSNYAAACYPAAESAAINGVSFKHVHYEDAGMMKYVGVESYRIVHDGRCYSVDQIGRGEHGSDESMTQAAQDARDQASRVVAAIVRSFHFIDQSPGQAGSPPGTAGTPSAGPLPVRLSFARGATTIMTRGRVPGSGIVNYVVGSAAGQPLMVSVQSPSLQESLSIRGASDGARLLDSEHQTYWQGMLRVSEDYLIQVRDGPPGEEFTLDIRAPAPVRFGPSGVSSQLSGHTPGGLPVQYVLAARAGQLLLANLVSSGTPGVIEVRGFEDGQMLTTPSDPQHGLFLSLPSTENYLVTVMPPMASDGPYTLDLMIPAVAIPWSPIVAFPGLGRACFWQSMRISTKASRKTIYSTVDDGKTWRTAVDLSTDGWITNIGFADENEGYLAAINGGGPHPLLFRTADGGAHWDRIDLPVPAGVDPESIRDAQTSPPSIPVGSESGIVGASVHIGNGESLEVRYATLDGGITWTAVPR
jgi:hypothetical protein